MKDEDPRVASIGLLAARWQTELGYSACDHCRRYCSIMMKNPKPGILEVVLVLGNGSFSCSDKKEGCVLTGV
jgi:hypothetical protein